MMGAYSPQFAALEILASTGAQRGLHPMIFPRPTTKTQVLSHILHSMQSWRGPSENERK